jgi:hypothetical protein
MKKYPEEIEKQMKRYYQTLSEKDRRRYAAIEAIKLEYGNRSYICELFCCDYKTVAKGIKELRNEKILLQQRVRQEGGGAKAKVKTELGLKQAFLNVLKEHIAGSPTNEKFRWTNLSQKEIAKKLEEQGFKVSVNIVKQLLNENKFGHRKASKTKAGKQCIGRDEQFKKIAWLKENYLQNGNPVISMDTKKKNQ